MSEHTLFHIGTPGVPWGVKEVEAWRASRNRQRGYAEDVVARIDALRGRLDVVQYGELVAQQQSYPLYALKSRGWNEALPVALVTGGVHGYETSGVHGALRFLDHHAADYAGKVNLLVAPCISPWAYERIPALECGCDRSQSQFPRQQSRARIGCPVAPDRAVCREVPAAHRPARNDRLG